EVPGEVDASPQGARLVERPGEVARAPRLPAVASREAQGGPVIPLGSGGGLLLCLGRQCEGLQAGASRERGPDGVLRWRRRRGVLLHGGGLEDGERLGRTGGDADRQVMPVHPDDAVLTAPAAPVRERD